MSVHIRTVPSDSRSIVKGSSDMTKLVRIEADGLTTATTRVLTMPDKDLTPAAAGANSDITALTGITGRLNARQGADVASANDVTLGTDGNVFEITGTTQINTIATTSFQNGSMIVLLFTGSVTVKHATAGAGAVLNLSGSADFSATAGDTLTLILGEIGGAAAWREVARTAI